MKFVLSFVFSALLISHISAQLFTHYGGAVGFGQSNILGEKSEFERVKGVQNFSIGLVGEHHFEGPFLITSELNFYGSGDSTIYNFSNVENNSVINYVNRYKNTRYYLQVPVCIGLNIPSGEEDTRVIIKAGAYYGSLIGSRTSGKERVIAGAVVTDTLIDARNYHPYPKKDFGLVAAIGYGSDKYSLEFRFNKGLTSLFNQSGVNTKYNFAYMVTLCGFLPN
jgi:hypothetical protein